MPKRQSYQFESKLFKVYRTIRNNPFYSFGELIKYYLLLKLHQKKHIKKVLSFRIKHLNGATINCRLGTTDYGALNDLLFSHYYLPPKDLDEPNIIIDLGVNIGLASAHFAHIYPTARIIGLEPDQDNYRMAVKNTRSWQERITLLNAAIWMYDGEVNLLGDQEDAYKVTDHWSENMKCKVIARSVQSIISEYHLDCIDYLKVDIEGAEETIFNKESGWLSLVKVLKIEIHNPEVYDYLNDILTLYGFYCCKDTAHWNTIIAIREK